MRFFMSVLFVVIWLSGVSLPVSVYAQEKSDERICFPAEESDDSAEESISGVTKPTEENGITYVTGGIGEDERKELLAVKKDYNFHVMSADVTGPFSGDLHLVLRDETGAERLNVDAGPLFYAKLPDGRYVIEGTNGSETKKQSFVIKGSKPVHVHFGWKQVQ